MPQQPWLREVVFSTLLTSTLPILRATPDAPFDGAIYNGPISISKIPHYANRLHAVQTTKTTNPVHRIIGFKVLEMQLHDDENGTSKQQQRIRVSVPEHQHHESVEFYILGWGPSSRERLGDDSIHEANPYGMDQSHVAIVPRAVARHFQTYKTEFMDAETLRRSVFPPSLYTFMVGLDGLAEALSGLLETARVDGAVDISPEAEVPFTGWKVYFVEDLRGLDMFGNGELAVPDRETGSGGEHYFRYK